MTLEFVCFLQINEFINDSLVTKRFPDYYSRVIGGSGVGQGAGVRERRERERTGHR